MSGTGTHNFKTVTRGDIFKAKTITVIRNGSPLNITDAQIRCQFRFAHPLGPVSQESTTENGGITIVNGGGGVYRLNSFLTTDFFVGTHFYDIEILLGDDWVRTYIGGKLNIRQDTTNLDNG